MTSRGTMRPPDTMTSWDSMTPREFKEKKKCIVMTSLSSSTKLNQYRGRGILTSHMQCWVRKYQYWWKKTSDIIHNDPWPRSVHLSLPIYIFFQGCKKGGGEELTLPACLFACLPACCRGVRGQGREVTTLGLEKILKEEFQAIFASFAFHEYCSRQGAETQVILLAGVKLPRRDRSSEVIRSA